MAPPRAPKRARWRRLRGWSWALASAGAVLVVGGLLTRRLPERDVLPPAAPPMANASVVQPDVGDVVLPQAPAIRGIVQQADGRPAPGALVTCEGCGAEDLQGGDRHLTALSDAKGRFTLPVVVPYGQRFRLVARKDGQLGWAEAGRAGEEALLTLAAPASIRGRVLGPGGKPALGVAVVFSEPLLEPVRLVTGRDGTFSGSVPPGLYQVTVVPDASEPRRTWTVQVPAEQPLELATGAPAL